MNKDIIYCLIDKRSRCRPKDKVTILINPELKGFEDIKSDSFIPHLTRFHIFTWDI